MRSQERSGVRLRRYAIAIAVLIVGFILIGFIADVLVDWLWFSSIGYVDVFWVVFSAQALVFIAVFTVSASAICLSGFLAHRYARSRVILQAVHASESSSEGSRRPQFIGELATSHRAFPGASPLPALPSSSG